MSSTASPRTWLPAALARAAALLPAGLRNEARDDHGSGPQPDPWLFDPARDDDPFEWLGFAAERD